MVEIQYNNGEKLKDCKIDDIFLKYFITIYGYPHYLFKFESSDKLYISQIIFEDGDERCFKYIDFYDIKNFSLREKIYHWREMPIVFHNLEGPACILGGFKYYFIDGIEYSIYEYFKKLNYSIDDLIIYTLDNCEDTRNAACRRIEEIESQKDIRIEKETLPKNIFKNFFTKVLETFF